MTNEQTAALRHRIGVFLGREVPSHEDPVKSINEVLDIAEQLRREKEEA